MGEEYIKGCDVACGPDQTGYTMTGADRTAPYIITLTVDTRQSQAALDVLTKAIRAVSLALIDHTLRRMNHEACLRSIRWSYWWSFLEFWGFDTERTWYKTYGYGI